MGLYGVGVGCVGKCGKNPCMNGGTCLEGYDSFNCDCRWTPFKGPICADEIGVNMRNNYMIKYDFKGRYKSTIAEKIHVGFTTTDPKGFLIGLFSDISNEYMTLMVSNSGHIRLVFDFGFERQELVFTEQNFMTGQYHDVKIERYNNGRNLRMTIDNYAPQEYDFSVITEDFCGIEPCTLKPEEAETRRAPEIDQEAVQDLYDNTNSVVLGITLAFIFFLLVLVCIGIGKYMNRHKGDYYTKEDEGAHDAFDADTAVLQGRTGHQVTKKKEWFI